MESAVGPARTYIAMFAIKISAEGKIVNQYTNAILSVVGNVNSAHMSVVKIVLLPLHALLHVSLQRQSVRLSAASTATVTVMKSARVENASVKGNAAATVTAPAMKSARVENAYVILNAAVIATAQAMKIARVEDAFQSARKMNAVMMGTVKITNHVRVAHVRQTQCHHQHPILCYHQHHSSSHSPP